MEKPRHDRPDRYLNRFNQRSFRNVHVHSIIMKPAHIEKRSVDISRILFYVVIVFVMSLSFTLFGSGEFDQGYLPSRADRLVKAILFVIALLTTLFFILKKTALIPISVSSHLFLYLYLALCGLSLVYGANPSGVAVGLYFVLSSIVLVILSADQVSLTYI